MQNLTWINYKINGELLWEKVSNLSLLTTKLKLFKLPDNFQLKNNDFSCNQSFPCIWFSFWYYVIIKYDVIDITLAKAQELKKDIEVLSQTFERVIDRKEAIIKSLVKDLEEAEEQYQMAQRSHLQNEDRLIGEHFFICPHNVVLFLFVFASIYLYICLVDVLTLYQKIAVLVSIGGKI